MITIDQFKSVFPRAKDPEGWVRELSLYLPRYDINTKYRLAAFLSQCGHESAGFSVLSENLNYSARALVDLWPKRFTPADAAACQRKPEKIANKVYCNRMGNGPESSGDGWKFRGRGLIQMTGRANYQQFADFIADQNVVKNPDVVCQQAYAVLSACWYWSTNHLNVYADSCNVELLSRRINGGLYGLAERKALYSKIYSLL